MAGPRNAGYRREPLWRAAMVHRVSGLLLALFLPLHFLALALALHGETSLDRFLRWTDQPLFKAAETILVGLLAVHLLGGLRLLIIENMPWRPGQKQMAMAAISIALLVAAAFLVRII
ncbi:MAG: succinate dehydrogenase, cytochrome b subunit [Hyphomicrobiaceae bacterium]|nr:succinate dehydrogenase, cytochrome b subunit [Hyphomicrobiaceae bacterium]